MCQVLQAPEVRLALRDSVSLALLEQALLVSLAQEVPLDRQVM